MTDPAVVAEFMRKCGHQHSEFRQYGQKKMCLHCDRRRRAALEADKRKAAVLGDPERLRQVEASAAVLMAANRSSSQMAKELDIPRGMVPDIVKRVKRNEALMAVYQDARAKYQPRAAGMLDKTLDKIEDALENGQRRMMLTKDGPVEVAEPVQAKDLAVIARELKPMATGDGQEAAALRDVDASEAPQTADFSKFSAQEVASLLIGLRDHLDQAPKRGDDAIDVTPKG